MADSKTLKDHVVSFRVPQSEAEIVTKMLGDQANRIIGCKSVNQFFRKIGRDFLRGKLNYKNPDDYHLDTDVA